MKRKKKRKAVRLSASFYRVACRSVGTLSKLPSAGTDLWPTIVGGYADGRDGAAIQRATLQSWASAGLVVITTRKPRADEHHLANPIDAVTITAEGVRRVREREERERARAA